ncbi:hypothetical protein TURU_123361 [Turdus rufiventris]|nr:hypothetical protein TURU_123361 [Turdus rufiventris]
MQDRTMTRSVDRNSCDECMWNFAFPERVVLIVKVYRQGVLLELLKVSSGHTSNRVTGLFEPGTALVLSAERLSLRIEPGNSSPRLVSSKEDLAGIKHHLKIRVRK